MRPLVLALVLPLAACAPAPTDDPRRGETGIADTDADTGSTAPVVPPPPVALSGRVAYEARRCPLTGEGELVPKGAIVQAWACNGPSCWPVPELLAVERGEDEDEASFVGCSGADRFEIAWIAIVP